MLLLINKIVQMNDDSYQCVGEFINTDDVKSIRKWHLKGELGNRYPNGFSLITMKGDDAFKVEQSLEQINDRINGMKKTLYGEEEEKSDL